MDWMETNGVCLRYELAGDGPQTVLLIHELGGALDSFDECVGAFQQHFRTLRYDQRGFGHSEKVRTPMSMADMVADIVGSTKLSQSLPGAQFPRMTGNWFKNCRQIIDECGGHMSKYLGDGFFCYWDDTEDSAIQVRQAVAKLYEAQHAANPPFRLVLHFGAAMLGTVPTMNELNLHGPEVNFVFRADKVAATQKQNILFTEAAVKRMAAEKEVRLVSESPVEGFSSPYKFYTLSH